MVGSGILPIIKHNNKYYYIMFKSRFRNVIEDSGGKQEGNSRRASAIRELFEESSGTISLFNISEHDYNKMVKIGINGYFSYLVILNFDIDFEEIQHIFCNGLLAYLKNGLSVYTEMTDIAIIPAFADQNIKVSNVPLFNRTKALLKIIHRKYGSIDKLTKLLPTIKMERINDVFICKYN